MDGSVNGRDLSISFLAELVDAIAERVVERLDERAVLAATGPERWIGVDEAAEYIGKPKSRLYDLVAQDLSPHGRRRALGPIPTQRPRTRT